MLTHGNLACNFSCSLGEFGLSRVVERVVSAALAHHGAACGYALLHGGVTLLIALPRGTSTGAARSSAAILCRGCRVCTKRFACRRSKQRAASQSGTSWTGASGWAGTSSRNSGGRNATAWSCAWRERIVFSQSRRAWRAGFESYIPAGALGRSWRMVRGRRIRIHRLRLDRGLACHRCE